MRERKDRAGIKPAAWMIRMAGVLCLLLLFFAGAAGMNQMVFADEDGTTGTYKNFEYEIISGKACITGYSGSASSVTIPSEIDHCKVVMICARSFYVMDSLKSVTIPSSVQTVEGFAFSYCTSLEKITVQGEATLFADNAVHASGSPVFVCSSTSKAYIYVKNNSLTVSLTDGISLSDAKITLSETSLAKSEAGSASSLITVKVRVNGKLLTEGTDYKISWPTSTTVGKKTLTVKAIDYNADNYTGEKTASYEVVPDSPDAVAAKAITTTSVTLKWSKVTEADGYKIYRYNSSSKSYKLVKTITKKGTTTWKDTGRKKNTKYLYQVAAYKKANGKTYCSDTVKLTVYTLSGKTTKVSSTKSAKISTNTVSVRTAVETENYDGNWAQVSEISDFIDARGRYTIAYDSDSYVYISIFNNSTLKISKTIKIKKKYELLGTVTCDSDGNYYIIWGQSKGSGGVVLAVSKYTSKGKFVKSCKLYNTGDSFDTLTPFYGGNCAAAFQGDILVCSYARRMNNTHQSNDVFCVDVTTMKEVDTYDSYVSHSFDQRVLALSNGDVLFADLGDAYPRGFSLTESGTENEWSVNTFRFYGSIGQNKIYARLGGVGEVSTGIVLVGTSARSMTSAAAKEDQQLFMKIISPVTLKSAISGSSRSGTVGGSSCTDTGIKWLTNYDDAEVVASAVTVMEKDQILIMWEKEVSSSKYVTYYMVVSATGKVLQKATKIGTTKLAYVINSSGSVVETVSGTDYRLNECEEIKYEDGCVYWTTGTGTKSVTVHKLYVGKFTSK